jgi:hypothetical protein
MTLRPIPPGAALLAVLWTSACTGSIQSGDTSPTGDTGSPTSRTPGQTGPQGTATTSLPAANTPNVPGPAPLRRLSKREYNNTIRDLLGLATAPANDFGSDQDRGGFAIGGPVTTSADVSKIVDAADQLSLAAADKIGTLVPCPGATDPAAQTACAHQFITQFGRRAYRRPVTTEEADLLFAVYTAHRAPEIGFQFADAIRSVVAAMLSSPQFIYRAELGGEKPIKDGNLIRFNSYEMASRLSYGLWSTMPDDLLSQAADQGKLSTPEQIDAQVRRMLADPRAKEAITDFHLQWLDIDGLPNEPPKDARFATYTPALVQAMMKETIDFVSDAVLGAKGSGNFDKLLTSSTSFMDPALGTLYGANATAGQAVTLDPSQRAGILTQASFLSMHASATESHPVKRGATVTRRLLCIDVQPPPNMDVGMPAMPAPGLTTRDRFAMHAEQACATCHKLTDPVGFAFENYDAIGAWRTMDQGKPVNASGSIALKAGVLSFNNAIELAKGLAQSNEARECMATQWMRFLTRRTELLGDQASLDVATDAFRQTNDIRELLVALTKTRSFTHRTPSIGEVAP